VTGFLSLVCVVVYLGGLLAAALWDMTTYTIPNRLVAAIGCAGLVALAMAAPDLRGFAVGVGLALAVLAVGAMLFAVHLWGAGDAKLFAAVSLWTGTQGTTALLVRTAMFGGLFSLVLVALRHLPFLKTIRRKLSGTALLSSTQGVPYGVAIAAGGIVAFFSHDTVLADAFLPH
jgi:prepilin peptidase CpaA